jgi:hypothetical protein
MRQARKEKTLALFVGSGFSLGSDVSGGFPAWGDLPERLLAALHRMDEMDEDELSVERARLRRATSLDVRLSDLGALRTRLGRSYAQVLSEIFRPADAAPGAAHRAAAALGLPLVITTNYDQLLEKADPSRQPYTWRNAAEAFGDLQRGRPVLLKVHGSAEDPTSVVMSDLEYTIARRDSSYRTILGHLLQSFTFLFVGYGMSDPLDLDIALRSHADAFKAAARRHYVLLRGASDVERDRLERDYGIRVIPYADHAEVTSFLTRLLADGQSEP